ncbi:hypothetical protein [Cupriavidus plantarum]|uniref:hypothetical protein n=1 Tax=Cupriavidus plantarum TaxID=942865 RepID=UPI000F172C64|nr:hypothetical protein [Cupriavidus plantarum]RLK39472.1 hypothetical protein C7417_3010 [Cupriavidus plantarum]CAG2133541.1 hypothetical protein LMG26296_01825 [Cupriavidus plantarum]SMR84211.1 hypothetical protein SAMN05421735_2996 [Cupriavidus plantarum]
MPRSAACLALARCCLSCCLPCCLLMAASPALADARARATAECRKAVKQQGHENARFDAINAMEGRTSMAVIGEITDGGKRFAFQCNFDKALKVTDLPMRELPASAAPSAPSPPAASPGTPPTTSQAAPPSPAAQTRK